MRGFAPRADENGFIRKFAPPEIERICAEAARRIRNHPNPTSWSADKCENRERNERMGVASEWAAFNWLGLPEDPVFEDHGPGGDGGVDLVLPDGRRGEVKSTGWVDGVLILPPYQKAEKLDFLVLCISYPEAWTIHAVGYATRADWQEHHYLRDFGSRYGPQPVMAQRKLRAFAGLVEST